MIHGITPVLLTYNEGVNISQTLDHLKWAKDIVIVDSFSQDETLSIVRRFPQARIFQREFDQHAKQWNFAIQKTEIQTEWILALDADYILTEEFIDELKVLTPQPLINGYQVHFLYRVLGRPLHACLYPPRVVLFRKGKAFYEQDGHTQRLKIEGGVQDLHFPVLHDDRKPFRRWLISQKRYAVLEAEKLRRTPLCELSWPDRIRKMRILSPALVLFYCLFYKGLLLDGWPGIYYTFQRVLAEGLLSLRLIQHDFNLPTVFNPSNRNIESSQTKGG